MPLRRHSIVKVLRLGLLLALLLASGPIEGWHHAHVRHAVCSEHGELIHVAAALDATSARVHEEPSVDALAAGVESHELCPVAEWLRERPFEATTPTAAPVLVLQESLLAALRASRASPPIAVLERCPKTSPPLV